MTDGEHGPSGWHDWRQEAVIVIAILTAVTCLFYSEIVFLGRTILPLSVEGVMGLQGPYGYEKPFRNDLHRLDRAASTWQFEPLTRKAGDEFRSGGLPLWNDSQAFGMPLLADAVSGTLSPLHAPLFLNASPVMWDLYYLARTLLGGLATYLFARCVGLSVPARFFLAIAYIFSGHFVLLVQNHFIEAYVLLPVILLGTELTLGNRPRLGFALTAVAVALNLLVGMPESSLAVLLFCAAYGAYQLLRHVRQQGLRRDWTVRAALLVGAWLVGIALAAPLLLPLFEFVTHASTTTSRRETYGLNHAPLADFVIWFMPFLKGFPLYLTMSSISTYAGATVVVLALYGLFPAKTEVYQRLVPFAAIAAALLLAKTFGLPGINELGRLPGLNVTHISVWFSPLTGFCLALLASVGVHHLSITPVRPVAAASVLVVFLALVVVGAEANWVTNTREWSAHVVFAVGVAVLFAVAVWLTIQFFPTRHLPLRGVACCVLLLGELFLLAPHGVYQDRYDRFAEAPYVTFLKKQQETSAFRIFGAAGLLFPNFASAFGLHDIRALNALYVDRYMVYIRNFISPDVTDRFVGVRYATEAEKAALTLNNPWFDLTGVRYVIAAPGSPTAIGLGRGLPIIDGIYTAAAQAGRTDQYVHVDFVTINEITKRALFEYPRAKVDYPMRIEAEYPVLRFAVALRPEVWDPAKGDGVAFEVEVETAGKSERVYRRDIDPKHDPADRRWIDDSVDLSRFVGQDIVLTFVTKPLMSKVDDWAVWGDIWLTPADREVAKQYTTAYDDEVRIFENHHALPRAFLVRDVISVNNMEGALAAMKENGIDPRHTAVVEGAPASQVAALGAAAGAAGGGTATIAEYTPQQVRIEVEAASPSLLLLTDAVYPGWVATVDGQEVPIYATDVAFRGVFVPAGQHRVEFSYEPMRFLHGMGLAALGVLVLLAVVTRLDPRRWPYQ